MESQRVRTWRRGGKGVDPGNMTLRLIWWDTCLHRLLCFLLLLRSLSVLSKEGEEGHVVLVNCSFWLPSVSEFFCLYSFYDFVCLFCSLFFCVLWYYVVIVSFVFVFGFTLYLGEKKNIRCPFLILDIYVVLKLNFCHLH